MILQWIDSLESLLANLIGLLIQLLYLCALLICCVGVATIICLPFIAVYWHYLDRKKANAKRNPPSEPTAIAEADPVKGRAPGLSEHAPPFGQTEARAERTLERPPP